jgi:hypothetical protein
MTELMKRYEAETGYTIKEAIKNHTTFHYWDRYFEWVGKLALSLLEENAKLKAQLTGSPSHQHRRKYESSTLDTKHN